MHLNFNFKIVNANRQRSLWKRTVQQITVYAAILLGRQNIGRRGYQASYVNCKNLTRDSDASYISLIFFLSDESLVFKFSEILGKYIAEVCTKFELPEIDLSCDFFTFYGGDICKSTTWKSVKHQRENVQACFLHFCSSYSIFWLCKCYLYFF